MFLKFFHADLLSGHRHNFSLNNILGINKYTAKECYILKCEINL
jgi:hypothetical protein